MTLNSGTIALTGGAAIETVTVGAGTDLTSADTLTGAGGTDVIDFAAASTVTDAMFTNVTTFETITAGNFAQDITLGLLAKAAGIVTVTLGNATNTVNASAYTATTLTITGGSGADTIQGGTGADILSGGAGADVYKFNATGALNGNDTFTMVVADDKLDFSNMGSFTVDSTQISATGTTDVVIDNKIVYLDDATGLAAVNTTTLIAALIEGNGDAMHISSGGKAIILAGDNGAAGDEVLIYLVDDSVGAVAGTISADDIVLIGTTSGNIDLDTITPANFV